jgi:ATP-binding cassette subfamily B protein
MDKSFTTKQLLISLWHQLRPRRKKQFGFLLILMIVTSFSEIFTLGAVLPFLAVLTAPQLVFEHPSTQFFIQGFGLKSQDQLILPITIFFCLAIISGGSMRLLLLWATTRISFVTGAEISFNIYRRTLYQPYLIHVARNSNDIINSIWSKSSETTTIITMLCNFIAACFILATVIIVLLFMSPFIALISFFGFGSIYALILFKTRNLLFINSQSISRESTSVLKALQEGLACIRDVLIDGSQETFLQIYRDADQKLRRAYAANSFIGGFPRHGVETIGTLLIALSAYSLSQQTNGLAMAIPILGTIAYSAQRLLPVLQQGYGACTYILAGRASLQDVLLLLEQPLPEFVEDPFFLEPIPFHKDIELRHLSFRYNEQTPWILKNLNLSIEKGSKVGLIGETGSGKSTLLDVLMGLLQPTEGSLEIDGRSLSASNLRTWQVRIAHVPQVIFLIDSTIEENIAFGVPKNQIDQNRVRKAAHQAQIANTIEGWSEQYQTFVGERGVRLSGGQRQRIGIARALYKQADVIVFDEATSALDNETELAVTEAIESLGNNLTVIIVAHRLSTLRKCSKIIELAEGGILRTGTYEDLVS